MTIEYEKFQRNGTTDTMFQKSIPCTFVHGILLIFSLLMIPVDNANNKAYKEYKEKTDYQKCCAENDFAAAHAIQTEFYTEY